MPWRCLRPRDATGGTGAAAVGAGSRVKPPAANAMPMAFVAKLLVRTVLFVKFCHLNRLLLLLQFLKPEIQTFQVVSSGKKVTVVT